MSWVVPEAPHHVSCSRGKVDAEPLEVFSWGFLIPEGWAWAGQGQPSDVRVSGPSQGTQGCRAGSQPVHIWDPGWINQVR